MPNICFRTGCTFSSPIYQICRFIFKACAEAELIINQQDKAQVGQRAEVIALVLFGNPFLYLFALFDSL